MPSEAGHRLYVNFSISNLHEATARKHNDAMELWTDDDGFRGRHLSYQRSRHTTRPGTSLIKIEGVDDTNAANFYLGKKVAFVYRGQKEIRGTKIRVIWGKVTRPHGNSGVVRAKFTSPLPSKSFGASVRVMLYPSSI
ncbi:60S ribosomal L33-A protein [Fusarium heterosporum]|uniref:60S ribosomal L33-A protein n=1 Tax=Fusarium heterosporum TaxID=42747 RepID=A0A8H5SP14_FUSHE|nr:60S ribosomal L33-A protein [Fusarium heterosporum]